MKKSILAALGFIVLSLPASAQPDENGALNLRAGLGRSFGPDTITILANPEYRVDEYLALGPLFQGGFSGSDTLYITTLGGRFLLPASFWKSATGAPLETSIAAGIGFSYRDSQGFRFRDFVYQFGMNADYVFDAGATVGVASVFNLFDNTGDRFFPALYLNAGYHF